MAFNSFPVNFDVEFLVEPHELNVPVPAENGHHRHMAGADRFYIRRPGLGILKLLTCGGILVWWIIDVVLLLREQMIDGYGRTLHRQR